MVDLLNLLKDEKKEEIQQQLLEKTKQQEQEIKELKEKLKKREQEHYENLILHLIIKKYSACINEHEIKTIEDLKQAIQPHNPEIIELISRFQQESPNSSSFKIAEKAYEFVATEIRTVPLLGINFWMSIKEILENRIADNEDKAILLCSLIKSVGLEAEVAIAELNEGSNKPFVLIKKEEGKHVLLDINFKHDFEKYEGTLEELKSNYEENNQRISRFLYKFNNEKYEELI